MNLKPYNELTPSEAEELAQKILNKEMTMEEINWYHDSMMEAQKNES